MAAAHGNSGNARLIGGLLMVSMIRCLAVVLGIAVFLERRGAA